MTLEEKRAAAIAFLRTTRRGWCLELKHTKARHDRMQDKQPVDPPKTAKIRRIR